VINEEDIVPQVPGNATFRHVWNPVLLLADGMAQTLGHFPDLAPADEYDHPILGAFSEAKRKLKLGIQFHTLSAYSKKLVGLTGQEDIECLEPLNFN
jgi:hypothetical protein